MYTSIYSVGGSLVHGFVVGHGAATGIIGVDTFIRYKKDNLALVGFGLQVASFHLVVHKHLRRIRLGVVDFTYADRY